MKDILVVGRCWKIIDFLIPTVDSVINYNTDTDLIIIDNLSTKTNIIFSYCKHLLRNNSLHSYIQMDKNYLGNVWIINKFLLHIYKNYKYLCFTDMDMEIINPQKNWLRELTGILNRNRLIGAVSIQFAKTHNINLPYETFIDDLPHLKLPNENFWPTATDGWFYTVRTEDFIDFISHNIGQLGPGSHGYNLYCEKRSVMIGRTNIYANHLGWLRHGPEYAGMFEETGFKFQIDITEKNVWELNRNLNDYWGSQLNWHGKIPIPNENSFKLYTHVNV